MLGTDGMHRFRHLDFACRVALAFGWLFWVGSATAESSLLGDSSQYTSALRDESDRSVVIVQRPLLVPTLPPPVPPHEALPSTTGETPVEIVTTPSFPPPVEYFPTETSWYDNQGCIATHPWYAIYTGSNFGLPCYEQDRLHSGLLLDGVVRGYYFCDERIRWSGNEATFGAEGVVSPRLVQHVDDWTVSANGVFFLNQPYDANMLADPSRRGYFGNFQNYPLYVWNLNVCVEYSEWRFTFGKRPTPFGRHYVPLQTNARLDAPFIRTEAIGWNETGAFLGREGDFWVFEGGIINGSEDLDTNSDKGLATRLGVKRDGVAAGISGKIHDGIGSEFQKRFDNQYGVDLLLHRGPWDISAEMAYDEYGYKKPEINQVPITWQRSFYYRDIYNGRVNGRLTGVGYYVNLGYTQPRYRFDFNFGEYYPRSIGNPLHDPMNRRFITKGTFLLLPRFETLVALIFENKRPAVEAFRANASPFALFTGVQTYF